MNITKAKNKLGCLPTGCVVSILLIIVFAVILLLIVRNGIVSAYEQFASHSSLALPASPESISPEALASLEKLKKSCRGETLTFSDQEINYFIAHEPGVSFLKNVVHVEMKERELLATFSVPLDSLSESPMNAFVGLDVAGKFLNGKAVGSPRYTIGQLLLNLQSLEINSEPAPEEGRMAAESWILKSDILKPGERVAEIRIEGGKLVIVCKG